MFQSRLGNAIANTKRVDSLLAVLLLDLDHFKDINDSLGHPVGDQLIKEAATRLVSLVRESDTVARLGGDEFGIVATNFANADDIVVLAQKLTVGLAKPYFVDGHQISTPSSIGITIYPFDDGDCEQILKHADLALYQAKRTSRGRFQFYDSELNERMHARRSMEHELREGLGRQEFVLFFQPKVNVSNHEITGIEALIRWNHPNKGILAPDLFIPVSEATGLIVSQGEWVIREACRQCAAWEQEGLPVIPISVNVSSVQFRRPGLVELVSKIISETSIHPSSLEIEITETVMMMNLLATMETLKQLHGLGVGLAIDDFGTGYSSLAYLSRFPVDTIKIDRSFVSNIVDDATNVTIAKSILSLGKNLRVVAEGVETKEQLTFLEEQGCDEAQGFIFCRPLPADEFATWYQEYNRSLATPKQAIS